MKRYGGPASTVSSGGRPGQTASTSPVSCLPLAIALLGREAAQRQIAPSAAVGCGASAGKHRSACRIAGRLERISQSNGVAAKIGHELVEVADRMAVVREPLTIQLLLIDDRRQQIVGALIIGADRVMQQPQHSSATRFLGGHGFVSGGVAGAAASSCRSFSKSSRQRA